MSSERKTSAAAAAPPASISPSLLPSEDRSLTTSASFIRSFGRGGIDPSESSCRASDATASPGECGRVLVSKAAKPGGSPPPALLSLPSSGSAFGKSCSSRV